MSKITQQEIATPLIATTEETKKKSRKITTKKITYCATLIAATLILKMLGQGLQFGVFKISFVYIGWILSAIMFGPVGGAVVGFCTDLLGTFILPTGGAPLPLIVFSNTLFPFIVGVIYKYCPPKSDNIKFAMPKIVIGTALATLICTLGLSSLALVLVSEGTTPFIAVVTTRLPQTLIIAANAAVVCILLPLLKKYKVLV